MNIHHLGLHRVGGLHRDRFSATSSHENSRGGTSDTLQPFAVINRVTTFLRSMSSSGVHGFQTVWESGNRTPRTDQTGHTV